MRGAWSPDDHGVDGVRRVLVVDDHPRARQALRQVVEATPGLRLEAALKSGEAAVAHTAAAQVPLLVVMDVRVPGMGGSPRPDGSSMQSRGTASCWFRTMTMSAWRVRTGRGSPS